MFYECNDYLEQTPQDLLEKDLVSLLKTDLFYLINGESDHQSIILLTESAINGILHVIIKQDEHQCILQKFNATACKIFFNKNEDYKSGDIIPYNFIFSPSENTNNSLVLGNGTFTKLPTSTEEWQRAPNIGSVSCNDVIEDYSGNLSLWKELESTPRDITFHLGDQIYGDRIIEYIMHSRKDGNPDLNIDAIQQNCINDDSNDFIYQQYKKLYIITYHKIQNALRIGSNIMLPDDHEFFDGVGIYGYYNLEERIPLVKAAYRAFKEYQISLRLDGVDENDTIYLVRRWGDLTYIGIDLRIDRFAEVYKKVIYSNQTQYEKYPTWISERQSDWVKECIIKNSDTKYLLISTGTQFAPSELFILNYFANFASEFAEAYFNIRSRNEADSFLEMLFQSDVPNIIIINGDVHKASITKWKKNEDKTLLELTSSGITVKTRGAIPFMSKEFFATCIGDVFFPGNQIKINEEIKYHKNSKLLSVGNNVMTYNLHNDSVTVNLYTKSPLSYLEAIFMQTGIKKDTSQIKHIIQNISFT